MGKVLLSVLEPSETINNTTYKPGVVKTAVGSLIVDFAPFPKSHEYVMLLPVASAVNFTSTEGGQPLVLLAVKFAVTDWQ
jgi:hypothetical protein